ncbi:MAG: glycosyltransferase family 4 protein [Candidatus Levybacteria bacterium]|nr:glycosyltransferase family 4 protein [Candidatus Levybacteria bacterium]
MTIAIDVSPLESGHYLQHRVRGTGFYLQNLKTILPKYYPDNQYVFFNRGNKIENTDLVHYPYFEPFFLTLPVFSKNKRIVTVHDLTPLVFPSHFKVGLKGMLKWQIQKKALQNTDAIITDSKSSKKDIVKFAGIKDSKVNVVYLAAGEQFKKNNDTRFAARREGLMIKKIKEKYNLPEKFVLYVGDVTWNKNLPRLIEAVDKINVPLVMVGKALIDESIDLDNPWNKDVVIIREKIKSNKKIICLGFVSNEELVALYNAATVFAMPSLYEGFGLPILEAMSCGCPVVTSKEGSIPEITGEATLSVDAYHVGSIAKGIKDVFDDKDLQATLSEEGIEQSKKFSWEKTAIETMSVYRKVTRKP